MNMYSAAVCVVAILAAFHESECVISWTTPVAAGTTVTTTFTAVDEQYAVADVDLAPALVCATGGTLSAGAHTIERNSESIFGITSIIASGTLKILATKGLDYEQMAAHVLWVKCTDSTTAVGTATVTVPVTNVATDPVFPALSYCVIVAEFAAVGTTVATIAATDPEGSTPTYTLHTDIATPFDISIAGVITVKTTSASRAAGQYHVGAVYAADDTKTGTASLVICVGTSSQCATCSSTSGAPSLIVGSLTIFALLLAFLR